MKENEKTKNELMGVVSMSIIQFILKLLLSSQMKNMTEMHVQVLSAVRSIHVSAVRLHTASFCCNPSCLLSCAVNVLTVCTQPSVQY